MLGYETPLFWTLIGYLPSGLRDARRQLDRYPDSEGDDIVLGSVASSGQDAMVGEESAGGEYDHRDGPSGLRGHGGRELAFARDQRWREKESQHCPRDPNASPPALPR